jgi:multiple sugar transport system permease protein
MAQGLTLSQRREFRTAALFLSPNLILVGVFLFIPVVASFAISLLEWDVISAPEFSGIGNYQALAVDAEFWTSIARTGLFIAIAIPITLAASLGLAVLIDSLALAPILWRTVLFIPFAMSSVVVGLTWRWFYNPQYGLLNYLLSVVGIQGPEWLNDPTLALPSIVVVFVWQQVGFNMLLFLVALREVPEELRWASRVDGAGPWREFRHVVLPLISPITFFALLNIAINAFQIFDLAFVMTRGGPGQATTFVLQFIYDAAFGSFRVGYASAAAFVYILLIGVLTWVAWSSRRRWVLGED